MKRRWWLALGLVVAACSASERADEASGSEGTGGGHSGDGGNGASVSDGGSGGGFFPAGGSSAGGGDTCHTESAVGERKELDMLVVLDRSDSMAGSLWDGSVTALTTFFQDTASQGNVNVEYAPDDQTRPETIPQVDDEQACGGQPGWYYANPNDTTKVMLCPASCQDVQNNPNATITFAFGCPIIVK